MEWEAREERILHNGIFCGIIRGNVLLEEEENLSAILAFSASV